MAVQPPLLHCAGSSRSVRSAYPDPPRSGELDRPRNWVGITVVYWSIAYGVPENDQPYACATNASLDRSRLRG